MFGEEEIVKNLNKREMSVICSSLDGGELMIISKGEIESKILSDEEYRRQFSGFLSIKETETKSRILGIQQQLMKYESYRMHKATRKIDEVPDLDMIHYITKKHLAYQPKSTMEEINSITKDLSESLRKDPQRFQVSLKMITKMRMRDGFQLRQSVSALQQIGDSNQGLLSVKNSTITPELSSQCESEKKYFEKINHIRVEENLSSKLLSLVTGDLDRDSEEELEKEQRKNQPQISKQQSQQQERVELDTYTLLRGRIEKTTAVALSKQFRVPYQQFMKSGWETSRQTNLTTQLKSYRSRLQEEQRKDRKELLSQQHQRKRMLSQQQERRKVQTQQQESRKQFKSSDLLRSQTISPEQSQRSSFHLGELGIFADFSLRNSPERNKTGTRSKLLLSRKSERKDSQANGLAQPEETSSLMNGTEEFQIDTDREVQGKSEEASIYSPQSCSLKVIGLPSSLTEVQTSGFKLNTSQVRSRPQHLCIMKSAIFSNEKQNNSRGGSNLGQSKNYQTINEDSKMKQSVFQSMNSLASPRLQSIYSISQLPLSINDLNAQDYTIKSTLQDIPLIIVSQNSNNWANSGNSGLNGIGSAKSVNNLRVSDEHFGGGWFHQTSPMSSLKGHSEDKRQTSIVKGNIDLKEKQIRRLSGRKSFDDIFKIRQIEPKSKNYALHSQQQQKDQESLKIIHQGEKSKKQKFLDLRPSTSSSTLNFKRQIDYLKPQIKAHISSAKTIQMKTSKSQNDLRTIGESRIPSPVFSEWKRQDGIYVSN